MQEFVNFSNGVFLEVSEKGFTLVSKSGTKTVFDMNGEFLTSDSKKYLDEKAKPDWMRYFSKVTKVERKLIADWLLTIKPKGNTQKKYIQFIKEALTKVDYDYMISKIEPSIDSEGHIYFKSYNPVAVGLTCREWETKAKAFSKEYNSQLATLYELYLWYTLRIVQEKWTLEEVTEDSTQYGNYWLAPFSSHELEPSDIKKVGGESDGIGNTFKIVKFNEEYALCGGDFEYASAYYPIADVKIYSDDQSYAEYGTGVVVLRI